VLTTCEPAAFEHGSERAPRHACFHALGNAFGTRVVAQGVPMRTLQEMMGHRGFKTTPIYADYAPSDRDEPSWVPRRPV